ncbi:hypothetical protein JCM18899A_34210 [Nocardioides sp. AN3]
MTEQRGHERSAADVRHDMVRLLIEKVRRDPYPSGTMMDLIEEMLAPEDVPVYAGALMEKIQQDEFPSLDLMTRVRDLA